MNSIRRSSDAVARRAMLGGLALAPAVLASCSKRSTDPEPGSTDARLHDLGSDGMDAREIINDLEALELDERPEDVKAMVHPYDLVLSDASGETSKLPLPEHQFYLSVAPFLKTTHECHFHSLTTCVGELQDQAIDVLVTDPDDDTVVDGFLTTAPNGFLGLWLPRNRDLTIQCTLEGKSGSAEFPTYGEEAATCLTTLQMTT